MMPVRDVAHLQALGFPSTGQVTLEPGDLEGRTALVEHGPTRPGEAEAVAV